MAVHPPLGRHRLVRRLVLPYALLIIGTLAVSGWFFYGAAQVSKDIDFILLAEEENFGRLLHALEEPTSNRCALLSTPKSAPNKPKTALTGSLCVKNSNNFVARSACDYPLHFIALSKKRSAPSSESALTRSSH